ncbi:pentatricopeptide repeat-containing protein At4g02750 [Selaginella moellendorffii]|uniref:pentatricopeptide repeat-containing protein At4g02750 n=1 Tax=Selaginella moellendorffii TaxID=88036 RepID=UPI000D1CA1FC|nr:pentatricopeptide repeat-containing protein At4g02750 [Selaginella moellendorffii]|eukprot:XP_024530229.1 pentatricopeptide repeat-containing protein At4g02750 [Selaginella moellendorffii]
MVARALPLLSLRGGQAIARAADRDRSRLRTRDRPNLYMIAALVHNGRTPEARVIFNAAPRRNLVSWNSMIAAYARNGQMLEAREMIDRLPQQDVVSCNLVMHGIEEANEIFGRSDRRGQGDPGTLILRDFSLWIDAGAKLHSVDSSYSIFRGWKSFAGRPVLDRVPHNGTVAWNSLIQGVIWHRSIGCPSETLRATSLGLALADLLANAPRGLLPVLPDRSHARAKPRVVEHDDQRARPRVAEMDLEGARPDWLGFSEALDSCSSVAGTAHAAAVEMRLEYAYEPANDFYELVLGSSFNAEEVAASASECSYATLASASQIVSAYERIRVTGFTVSKDYGYAAIGGNVKHSPGKVSARVFGSTPTGPG